MKTNKPTTEFWTVLTMVNVLAPIYPIHLLLRANSVVENLFATCVLVGSLFLLVVRSWSRKQSALVNAETARESVS